MTTISEAILTGYDLYLLAQGTHYRSYEKLGARLSADKPVHFAEILNGDAPLYGGTGQGNLGGVEANPLPVHGRPWSLSIVVPPLSIVVFKRTHG